MSPPRPPGYPPGAYRPAQVGILATNELDEATLSSQEVLNGYKGQARAERGVRCLKAPQFLASSFSLNKPERVMPCW